VGGRSAFAANSGSAAPSRKDGVGKQQSATVSSNWNEPLPFQPCHRI